MHNIPMVERISCKSLNAILSQVWQFTFHYGKSNENNKTIQNALYVYNGIV